MVSSCSPIMSTLIPLDGSTTAEESRITRDKTGTESCVIRTDTHCVTDASSPPTWANGETAVMHTLEVAVSEK